MHKLEIFMSCLRDLQPSTPWMKLQLEQLMEEGKFEEAMH